MHESILRTLGVAAVLLPALVLATPSLGFAAADLIVTAVTNPPTDGLPRDSFVITATVNNNVAVSQFNQVTGPSTTKFTLVRTPDLFRKNLKGVQNVPGLAPQASDATGFTVEIFSDTLPGTYRVEACADSEGKVAEVSNNNNCRLTTGSIIVHDVPDLAVTAISSPPPSLPQGQSFSVTTTVVNTGAVPAIASTVKYYLCTPGPNGCLPAISGGTKIDLKGLLGVPALGASPTGTFTHQHTLEVRAETVVGSYRMQGCADSGKVVTEDDENDNCLTLPGIVQVTPQPDLVVKSVTVEGAPLTIDAGDELVIRTVVKNEGQANAAPSTIKLLLVDTNNPSAPKKNLKDKSIVPALLQGQKLPVQASLRTYEDTPAGVYTIQACADSDKGVGESEESNNCTDAPATMKVTVIGLPLSDADLALPALTEPQSSAVPGDPIVVTATVKNKGTGPSPDTVTRFNLVSGTGPTATRKNLKGVQPVPGLAAGATSAVPATVSIYSDTAPGSYFLEACAEGDDQLREPNENNNCRISVGQVTVQEIPNLKVTTIDNPPVALLQGQSFPAKETVKNTGPVTAPVSTVKYYLVSTADQSRIDLKGTQAVPSLGKGQIFSDTQEVEVRAETLPGSYWLQACADSGKVVPEPNEEDNCLMSTGTVQVTALPDLIVLRVTVESTPVTVALGASFLVTSVVKNQGLGDAGPSTTKFYLVLTPGAAQKKDLGGTQAVPAAIHGAKNPAQVALEVENDTTPATYYVLACADSAKAVTENDEGNNCTTSAQTVTVVP